MKTADRENPNSRVWLRNKPSSWGGRQETPSLNQAGWKVRKFPAEGEVFFLTFPFIELLRTCPRECSPKLYLYLLLLTVLPQQDSEAASATREIVVFLSRMVRFPMWPESAGHKSHISISIKGRIGQLGTQP
jgi:hypothetical protein